MIYQDLVSPIKDFVFKREFSFKNKKNTPKVLFFIPSQNFLNFKETSENSIVVKNSIIESVYKEIENQFNYILRFDDNISEIKRISQKKEKDFILLKNSFLSGISQRKETLKNISLTKRIQDIIENKDNDFFGLVTRDVLTEFSKNSSPVERFFEFKGNTYRKSYSREFRPITKSIFNINHEKFNYLTGFNIKEIDKLDDHSFVIKSFLDFAQNMYAFNTAAISNDNFESIKYDYRDNVFIFGSDSNNSIFDFIPENELFDYKKLRDDLSYNSKNINLRFNQNVMNNKFNSSNIDYFQNIDYQQLSEENKSYILEGSNLDLVRNFSFKKFISLLLSPSQLNNVDKLYITSAFSRSDNNRTSYENTSLFFVSKLLDENSNFFKLDFKDYSETFVENSSSRVETDSVFISNTQLDPVVSDNIKRFYRAKINYLNEKPFSKIYYDFKPLFYLTDNRSLNNAGSVDAIISVLENSNRNSDIDVSEFLAGSTKAEYDLEKVSGITLDRNYLFSTIDLIVKKVKLKSINEKNISLNFIKELINNVKKRKISKVMTPYLVDDFKDISVINKNNEIFNLLFTIKDSDNVSSNVSFYQNKKIDGVNFVSKDEESKINKSFIDNVTDVISNYYPQGYFMTSSILYDSILSDFQDFQDKKEIEEILSSSDILTMCLYFNYIDCLDKEEDFVKSNVVDLIVKRFLKTAILRNKNKDFNKKTKEFLFDTNRWIQSEGRDSNLSEEESKRMSLNREKSSESLNTIQNNVFEKENILSLNRKTCNLQSNFISFRENIGTGVHQALFNNVLPFVNIVNPKAILNLDLKKFFKYDFVIKKDIMFKKKQDNKFRVRSTSKYEDIIVRIYAYETEEEKDFLLDTKISYENEEDVYSNDKFIEIQDEFDRLFDKTSIFSGIEDKIISLINLVDKNFLKNSDLKSEDKVEGYILKNRHLTDLVIDVLKVYSCIFIDFIKKANVDVILKSFKIYEENIKLGDLVRAFNSYENGGEKCFIKTMGNSKIINNFLKIDYVKPNIDHDFILDINKIRNSIKEKHQEIIIDTFDTGVSDILFSDLNNDFSKEIIETYGLLLKSDFRQSFNADLIRMILLYVEDTQNSSRMIFNENLNNFIDYFNLSTEKFYRDINDENYVKKIKGFLTKQGIRNKNSSKLLTTLNIKDNRSELLNKSFFESIELERKLLDENILENKNVICIDCSLENLPEKNNLILINITPVDLNDDNKCYLPIVKVLSANLMNIDIDNKNNETYYVDEDLNLINVKNKNDYKLRDYTGISEKIEDIIDNKLSALSLNREDINYNIEDFYLKSIFENHFQSNSIKRSIKAKLDLDLYDYGEIKKELIASVMNTISEEAFSRISDGVTKQSFLNSLNSVDFDFNKEMSLGISSILSNNTITKQNLMSNNYEMFLVGFEEKNLKFFSLNESKSNYSPVNTSVEEKALLILNEINPEDLSDDKVQLYTDNSAVSPLLNFYIRIDVI